MYICLGDFIHCLSRDVVPPRYLRELFASPPLPGTPDTQASCTPSSRSTRVTKPTLPTLARSRVAEICGRLSSTSRTADILTERLVSGTLCAGPKLLCQTLKRSRDKSDTSRKYKFEVERRARRNCRFLLSLSDSHSTKNGGAVWRLHQPWSHQEQRTAQG